ncbi:hypothetical protein [Paenibacillus glycanilyticus]|jgi:transposase
MVGEKYNALEKLNIIEEVSRGEIGFLADAKKSLIIMNRSP